MRVSSMPVGRVCSGFPSLCNFVMLATCWWPVLRTHEAFRAPRPCGDYSTHSSTNDHGDSLKAMSIGQVRP